MKLKMPAKILLLVVAMVAVYFGFIALRPALGHKTPMKASLSNAPSAVGNVMLRLSGSNTIGADLAPKLARAFLQSKNALGVTIDRTTPTDSDVHGVIDGQPVSILITAKGTSTGFKDVIANKADIVMASRPITGDEASKISGVKEKVVALDGLVVIVGASISARSATKDSLAGMFSDDLYNVYAMDSNSGTYDTFKSLVMRNRDIQSSAKRFASLDAVVAAVRKDPKGVGFVSLVAAQNSTSRKIAVADSSETQPIVASQTSIRTEEYPLTRRLFFYSNNNSNQNAADFIDFAASAQAQSLVEEAGFIAQKIGTVKEVALVNSLEYRTVAQSNQRLDVNLRFQVGSSQLDTKAIDDLERIVGAANGRAVSLIGFSDSTGERTSNIALSIQRAQSVATQLRSKGIAVNSVTGLGPINPIAGNDTPEGRNKNRRVEVWLSN
jgi:phosphate transport system substrate-binding protein